MDIPIRPYKIEIQITTGDESESRVHWGALTLIKGLTYTGQPNGVTELSPCIDKYICLAFHRNRKLYGQVHCHLSKRIIEAQ
jgi:putative alpha-1,2-mannosidase